MATVGDTAPGASAAPDGRAALVLGHPGHELYVYGWLAVARPKVHVLTDGSGIGRERRLDATEALLTRRGASAKPPFGPLTDRQLYDALLDGETETFTSLLHDLARSLVEGDVSFVVGDSAEGFNPTHDVCRLLIQAACALAGRELGRPVASFEFAQFLPPPRREEAPAGAHWIELDEATFAEKLAVAEAAEELADEVHDALTRIGAKAFRGECLQPSLAGPGEYRLPDPPVYERYGEAMRRQGRVERVIRYRQHVLPVARALGRAAGGG